MPESWYRLDLIQKVKKAYGSLTGSQEREELLAFVQEWDELMKACTGRIEGLEKGYDFLRRNMILKRELTAWKRLAVVSAVISLVALLGVGCFCIIKL